MYNYKEKTALKIFIYLTIDHNPALRFSQLCKFSKEIWCSSWIHLAWSSVPVLKTARLRIGFEAQQKGQQVKFRRRGARSTLLHQLDFVWRSGCTCSRFWCCCCCKTVTYKLSLFQIMWMNPKNHRVKHKVNRINHHWQISSFQVWSVNVKGSYSVAGRAIYHLSGGFRQTMTKGFSEARHSHFLENLFFLIFGESYFQKRDGV